MSSRLPRAWRNAIWRFGIAAAIALLVGWWLHAIALCMLVIAVIWLGLGAYRLGELGRWLESGRRPPSATGTGLWA